MFDWGQTRESTHNDEHRVHSISHKADEIILAIYALACHLVSLFWPCHCSLCWLTCLHCRVLSCHCLLCWLTCLHCRVLPCHCSLCWLTCLNCRVLSCHCLLCWLMFLHPQVCACNGLSHSVRWLLQTLTTGSSLPLLVALTLTHVLAPPGLCVQWLVAQCPLTAPNFICTPLCLSSSPPLIPCSHGGMRIHFI